MHNLPKPAPPNDLIIKQNLLTAETEKEESQVENSKNNKKVKFNAKIDDQENW